jgi:hypothetical protein
MLPDAARIDPPALQLARMGEDNDRWCFGRSVLLWYDGPQVAIVSDENRIAHWLGVNSDSSAEPKDGMPHGYRTIDRWVLAPISAYEAEALAALPLDGDRARGLWMRRPILVVDWWETVEAAWIVPPESVIAELPTLLDAPEDR